MSAGPNHLGNFRLYINKPTIMELGTHMIRGIKLSESFKFPYSFFSSLSRFNKDKYKSSQNTDEEIYICTKKMIDHVFSFNNKNNFPEYLDKNVSEKDLTYGNYKAIPFAEIPDDIIDRFE